MISYSTKRRWNKPPNGSTAFLWAAGLKRHKFHQQLSFFSGWVSLLIAIFYVYIYTSMWLIVDVYSSFLCGWIDLGLDIWGEISKNGTCSSLICYSILHILNNAVHPWKLTCPPKRDYSSREYIFQPLIFRGHSFVFRGGRSNFRKNSPPHPLSLIYDHTLGWHHGQKHHPL